jgi:hypothetical protein
VVFNRGKQAVCVFAYLVGANGESSRADLQKRVNGIDAVPRRIDRRFFAMKGPGKASAWGFRSSMGLSMAMEIGIASSDKTPRQGGIGPDDTFSEGPRDVHQKLSNSRGRYILHSAFPS